MLRASPWSNGVQYSSGASVGCHCNDFWEWPLARANQMAASVQERPLARAKDSEWIYALDLLSGVHRHIVLATAKLWPSAHERNSVDLRVGIVVQFA